MNAQNLLLLLNAGISLFITVLMTRKFKTASAFHLAFLALVVALWSLIYLLYDLQPFYISRFFFVSASYFCETLSASVLLIFSLAYSNHTDWLRWKTILLLAIEPLMTQLLIWIKPTQKLFFVAGTPSESILFNSGIWADINSIYVFGFEIASLLLLTDVFSRKSRGTNFQSRVLLGAVFVPFNFHLVEVVSDMGMGHAEVSIIGYSVLVIGLAIGMHLSNISEIDAVTRELVVTSMSDGWMVLDLQNVVIDVNPAIERIIGMPRQNLFGKPIGLVLPDWPTVSNTASEGKELEMRRSVRALGTWRYLNVRLSILRDSHARPFGQLIIWRDITDRKMAEEARQRARDEMFVLLNAISNAASHSIKLDDFLSESVYQLIYPFQSQMIVVFLIEEYDQIRQNRQMHLRAHFGLTPDDQGNLDSIFTEDPMFADVKLTKQPLTIENAKDDLRVLPVFKQMLNLVILPLFTQTGESSRLLGMMLLGRKDGPAYSQDELIRLSAIAEQIANLVDSDRRRQLAIALSERESLMRDLHDSVSQKLYGLVTLTEAAQAALEAGSKVIPSQVLSKIGENARQAVKEMRLFLYQMQPVDLEKGSLVSALHHRLGAVEGRADLQARFLPDDGIFLSKEKEIALYFIAQEALNNILKHAHATQVLVKLKQTKKNIILDVADNGDGFELKKIDHTGMGLQNMKARTAQINGKIKITSKIGVGTTIRVMISRERKTVRTNKR